MFEHRGRPRQHQQKNGATVFSQAGVYPSDTPRAGGADTVTLDAKPQHYETSGAMRASAVGGMLCLCSCSLIATTSLPDNYRVVPTQQPDCSQSNWAAGVDMLLMVGTAIGGMAAATDAQDPAQSADRTSNAWGAVGLGALALLTGYSMFHGFFSTSECRDATEEAGFLSHGGGDWALPFLVLGAAARGAAAASTPPQDPDACLVNVRPTALCRDGFYSCSLNRGGTCSYHHGVAAWL